MVERIILSLKQEIQVYTCRFCSFSNSIYNLEIFFSTSDEKPTLPKLVCFRTKTGAIIDITKKVGTDCRNLGVMLLNDEDGSVVKAIVSQYQLDAVEITVEILTQWVCGKGKQPVSWRTLIDTLQDIGLTELATAIDESL